MSKRFSKKYLEKARHGKAGKEKSSLEKLGIAAVGLGIGGLPGAILANPIHDHLTLKRGQKELAKQKRKEKKRENAGDSINTYSNGGYVEGK